MRQLMLLPFVLMHAILREIVVPFTFTHWRGMILTASFFIAMTASSFFGFIPWLFCTVAVGVMLLMYYTEQDYPWQ